MSTEQIHTPVLLKEIIEYLNLRNGDMVLDATINGGGHAEKILERIGSNGKLIGIDQDEEVLNKTRIKNQDLGIKNIFLLNGNFRDMDKLLEPLGIKKLNAILFDFGMSSFHVDKSGRGFSFQKDEPLIMNYKLELGPSDLTAKEILNKWPEKEICQILQEYGEERYARKIATSIVGARKEKRFETTFDLVEVIQKNIRKGNPRINPATKTFQALRIAVNDELNALEEGLEKAWGFLARDGRMAVMSFHSLEDRIVKFFFKEKKSEEGARILTKKPIIPKREEIKLNPRSRSAKLRVIEK